MKPRKETFTIVVGDTPYKDWGLDPNYDAPIHAVAEGAEDYPIAEMFKLEKIGLFDVAEGIMEYDGDLTKEEIVEKLLNLGFNAMVGKIS